MGVGGFFVFQERSKTPKRTRRWRAGYAVAARSHPPPGGRSVGGGFRSGGWGEGVTGGGERARGGWFSGHGVGVGGLRGWVGGWGDLVTKRKERQKERSVFFFG